MADLGRPRAPWSGADPPTPERAVDIDGLTAALRLLKSWAGDPSYATIARRINDGRAANELTQRSTVAGYFVAGRRRLDEELLVAIVRALHPDPGYAKRWRRSIRIIRGEAVASTFADTQRGLPADGAAFIGRERELALLDRVTATVVVITGMAGVGKTRLALHAAHRLLAAGRYRDVQMFVDLRGFDDAAPPADPAAVLAGFLRHLGLAGEHIPPTLAGRVDAYRGRLGGRSALVLLDNADTERAVLPLLPDAPGCLALVTSRHAMSRLPGAVHLELDVLSPAESIRLLGTVAGDDRVASDAATAGDIARLLGYLPLALSVIGGHLGAHPDWTLADYLPALTALAMEGGVRRALALSDRDLPAAQRFALRLLAVQPGQSITVPAAAALTGQPVEAVRERLDALVGTHLVQSPSPDRYRLHDLVRAWAAERAAVDEPASRVRRGLTALFDHYRYCAGRAVDLLYPYEKYRRPAVDPPDPPVAAPENPTAWLEAERANLIAVAGHAARHGWPEHATGLCAILWRHLEITGQFTTGLVLCQEALHAARLGADRAAETHALTSAGVLHHRLGEYDTALEALRRALTLAREDDDRFAEGRATTNIGVVFIHLGRYDDALDMFRQALVIFRELDDRLGIARALGNIAPVYYWLGRYAEALDHYRQDYELTRAGGDRPGEGISLGNMAMVYNRLGRYDEARDCLRQALDRHREAGNRIGEGLAHDDIGLSYQGQGRYPLALEAHRRALDILRRTRFRTGEGVVLNNIGLAHQGLGRYTLALVYHRRALDIHRGNGDRPQEIATLNDLGTAQWRCGLLDAAAGSHQAALTQAEKARDRYEQARAHAGLGHLHDSHGRPEPARHHWRQALRLYTELGVPEADQLAATRR